MIVYPAIDLRGGRVVRLDQGDFERETRYRDDPVGLASEYAAAGAEWLHLVDLDAARFGRFMHLDVVTRIAVETGLLVQAGGGVRNEADVETLLDAGVDRVVVGSVAVRQPELVASWLGHFGGERLCVALDARAAPHGEWYLPVRGWTEESGITLADWLAHFARPGALRHVLCTDIARDGMLDGPNLALYRWLRANHPQLAIQASGGVRDRDDVAALRALGCAGAIVGKALLERRTPLAALLVASTGAGASPPC
jgi:phosphoribosylformimino-5-aminoimidazole carboxamide ribotide isomerase